MICLTVIVCKWGKYTRTLSSLWSVGGFSLFCSYFFFNSLDLLFYLLQWGATFLSVFLFEKGVAYWSSTDPSDYLTPLPSINPSCHMSHTYPCNDDLVHDTCGNSNLCVLLLLFLSTNQVPPPRIGLLHRPRTPKHYPLYKRDIKPPEWTGDG